MPLGSGTPRFMTLPEVSEILNISERQTYALVRRGELVAIKIGGRGQWRVEVSELEKYISQQYSQARDYIDSHPYADADGVVDRVSEDT